MTAARSCRHDPAHVDSETVKVQVEVLLAPTLDTEGEAIYTAHFSNPAFAEQSKNVTLPRGERINPFTDVTSQQFFYEPVLWAFYHEPQITNGMDATTFAPGSPCTRGQVVTFLWRAAGMPEPTSSNNPFTDVSAQKFYYNAVLWAVEKGITNGMSATTFMPDTSCNRGQIVTFLWRYAGEKAPEITDNPFTDVFENAFYHKAVLWAVENGVTKGMTDTAFEPETTCSRGQVVTFLFRAAAE